MTNPYLIDYDVQNLTIEFRLTSVINKVRKQRYMKY